MEKDMYIPIGTRMAQIRRSNNMTQEELADRLDVSPKHISHAENATSSLSLKNLIEFCKIFDCSLDYVILGKTGNPALSQLPDEIVEILQGKNENDLDLLKRFLQLFIEIKNKQE